MGNVRHFRRIHENDVLFLKMCVFCENSVNLFVFCWNCSFFVELSKERFESQDQAVTTNYRTRAQVRIKRSEQTTGLGQKSGSKGPLTFRSFQLPGNLTTGDQVVRITIEHLGLSKTCHWVIMLAHILLITGPFAPPPPARGPGPGPGPYWGIGGVGILGYRGGGWGIGGVGG